jgi:hypothetical protein
MKINFNAKIPGIRIEFNKFNYIKQHGSGEIEILSLSGDMIDNLKPGDLVFALQESEFITDERNSPGEFIYLHIQTIMRKYDVAIIKATITVNLVQENDAAFYIPA